MSHEIRTPINAILGLNEMILRESEDANILAYAGSIEAAGSTLLGIINDILDFSKIEAGKMEIVPVDYELSSILNDLVNMIQTRADDKGITLVLEFDKGAPELLNGDEVRIKQVITNILTNAVKYTHRGSVTFRVGYERVPEEPMSVYLLVAVEDTGIGIKPEDIQKLFYEFERIDEKRNRNIEGTGLGMNITKQLLALICDCFQHSPVFRIGGDECAVILERTDFENRERLMAAFDRQMEENRRQGAVVVSAGTAVFDPGRDSSVQSVFERSDARMYERKKQLKAMEPASGK